MNRKKLFNRLNYKKFTYRNGWQTQDIKRTPKLHGIFTKGRLLLSQLWSGKMNKIKQTMFGWLVSSNDALVSLSEPRLHATCRFNTLKPLYERFCSFRTVFMVSAIIAISCSCLICLRILKPYPRYIVVG